MLEFKDALAVLERYRNRLDDQFHKTNKHILDGSNKHITFKERGDFSLITPKVEKKIESGLADIFPREEYVPLLDVLDAIEEQTRIS